MIIIHGRSGLHSSKRIRTFYLPPLVWPMDDKADPLGGWPIHEVSRIYTTATEDLYGKLYIYLQRVFGEFLDRLATVKVDFELLNVDAVRLPEILPENKYARIEVRKERSDCQNRAGNALISSRSRISPILGIWAHRKPFAGYPRCCNRPMSMFTLQ